MMQFEPQRFHGVWLITPFYAQDTRGSFLKPFEQAAFQEHGVALEPYEVFYTSSAKGTIRGLHFQYNSCQDKLVSVLDGAAYDVIVDLREGSSTFGQWQGFQLSARNRRVLYVPKGFAHGFLALEEDTLFSYLCGGRYDPASDSGIIWNDPELNVRWPLHQVDGVILSEKDQALPSFSQFREAHGALPG